MRMQDCKEELHSLLLEDVSTLIYLWGQYLSQYRNHISAFSRCIVARFCKQTGYTRVHDWHRDPRCKFLNFCFPFSVLHAPPSSHLSFHLVIFPSSQALDLRSIKTHHWKIWSCSAVTGSNLVTGLDWVVDDVAGRLYYSSTTAPNDRLAPIPMTWKEKIQLYYCIPRYWMKKVSVSLSAYVFDSLDLLSLNPLLCFFSLLPSKRLFSHKHLPLLQPNEDT